MDKVRVGITAGDINGIGLEVILKALSNERILDYCTPIVYGSSKVVSYHKNIVGLGGLSFQPISDATRPSENKMNVLNCWQDDVVIQLGKISAEAGKYAYIALDRAFRDLDNGLIDVLVTAPINKKSMKMADFPFMGHTDFLASKYENRDALMMMIDDQMKMALVTAHVPLGEVKSLITQESLTAALNSLILSLQQDFGIESPHVAVLGLNPHAGDEGTIGEEEQEIIMPVILDFKERGFLVSGPYGADGFFGARMAPKFDAVLAMYHDQGLIPFKAQAFDTGVNYTAGLPIIRTSPDHGTAFQIAGKNQADPQSMRNAIYLAIDTFRKRKEFLEDRANVLKTTEKEVEK